MLGMVFGFTLGSVPEQLRPLGWVIRPAGILPLLTTFGYILARSYRLGMERAKPSRNR